MYAIMGATGNVGNAVARILLSRGLQVIAIGRDRARLDSLTRLGARPAVGDIADGKFLASALAGAAGVFAMMPPQYGDPAPLQTYAQLGEATAWALARSGIKRIVHLSSIGAHLSAGTGPIVALHDQEARLDQLLDVDLLHLRPGYFFENHFNAIGSILTHGAYCDMLPADVAFPMQSTRDIAAVVARVLTDPAVRRGARVLHLHGPRHYTMAQVATILGRAIGKPTLPYVQVEAAVVKAGMIQHGLSPAMAALFEDMCTAMPRPAFAAEMLAGPVEVSPTALEDWAPAFGEALVNIQRGQRLDTPTPLEV